MRLTEGSLVSNIEHVKPARDGNPPLGPSWPTRYKAIQIALGYVVLSCLWISLSGRALHYLVHDQALAAFFEDVKGWAFVLTTALLLYLAMKRHFGRFRQVADQLEESEERLRLIGNNLPGTYVFQYLPQAGGKPRFLYISEGVERVHGLKVEEVLRDASVCAAS